VCERLPLERGREGIFVLLHLLHLCFKNGEIFWLSLSTGEGLFGFGFLILELMPLLVLFGDSAMISLDKPVFKSAETCILLSHVLDNGKKFLFFINC